MGSASSKPRSVARAGTKRRQKDYYDHNPYWPTMADAAYAYPHPAYYFPAPVVMPEPQPYVPPQPIAAPPVVPPVARPVVPPAPPPQQPKKGKKKKKKTQTTVITFELPQRTPPPDLPRSLSPHQGRSPPPSEPPPHSPIAAEPSNPLPKLPVDIFTTTPYKRLLESWPAPPEPEQEDAQLTPPPPPPPPIYFNQDTVHAGFLNHSPHSVSFERVTYPTATHLIEATKFLPEDPRNRGVAQLICACQDLADVYRISHAHRAVQNPQDGESYMDKMQRVMYLKFNQHASLADLLLSTGDAPLVYDDPSDSFWGVGGANGEPGQNELGRMLEGIRAILRRERTR